MMKIRTALGVFFLLLSSISAAQNASGMLPVTSISTDTAFQKDLWDVVKEVVPAKYRTFKKKDPDQAAPKQGKKKIFFSLLPFASLTSYGGQGLVTSTNAGFYLGDKRTTFLSTSNFTPYWNFNKRFGLPLRSTLWTAHNSWNIQGDTRFLFYPQYTWGLGHSHEEKQKIFCQLQLHPLFTQFPEAY